MKSLLNVLSLNVLLAAATTLVVAGAPASADAQSKIGVVDITRAISETEDGRKARDKLKKLTDKRQKALDKQKGDLLKMKEAIEKQQAVLSAEVLAKKNQDLQKAFAELQTNLMEFQRELSAKEAELTKDILERMTEIVRRIGQKDGYSMILDRQQGGVVYVPSSYDLTDVLIQRYNAGEGKKSGRPKPKGKSKASASKK
ncbi:MAG: OmpH family outer membrane protein [Myxococcales bacterium]|nr:OmpH family outer membrane protein [Myxococcales bacterium]MDD9966612.1 OmpH family outer membrane protein [Myxococcales bacterium]